MLESLCNLFWFICGFAVELFVFICVERVTLRVLENRCYAAMKRAVWALECAVLFPVCFVINFHHFPYFLFAMACIAFSYALKLHDVDFGTYFRAVRTTWQDFVEHYDSLRGQNAFSPVQPQQGATFPASASPPSFQNQANAMPTIPVNQPVPTPAAASGVDALPQNQPQPAPVPITPMTPVPLRNLPTTVPYSIRPQLSNTRMGTSRGRPISPMNVSSNSKMSTAGSVAADFIFHLPDNVKSWVKQTWRRDSSIPPGLLNGNQENLCFINCILQTLSRSPHLLRYLELAPAPGPPVSPNKSVFRREVINVFRMLTVPEGVTCEGQAVYPETVSTWTLRKAISATCDLDLVKNPGSGNAQPQQDAAEFLLWFLNALHYSLGGRTSAATGSAFARPGIHNPPANPFPNNSAWTNSAQVVLERLQAAYGYPSVDMINHHIQRCHEELAYANGQDGSTYVHLVSNLTSLGWLLYKTNSNSIVDDLFTGQQVAACICLGCNHMSVSTDTFRILTLPIPTGHKSVTILNCFFELIVAENLTPQNRPRFDSCKCLVQNNHPDSTHYSNSPFQTSTPNGPVRQRAGSAPGSPGMGAALSPINGVYPSQPQMHTESTPMSLQPVYSGCQRQTSVQRLPDCLVVQLLRFGFVNQRGFKIDTQVEVSVGQIDLSSLILIRPTCQEPLLYSLYGACMHANSSSTQSGHYYSYALANDGQWYLFNDSTVRRVDIVEELNKKDVKENVYLLYYRKVTGPGQF